MNILVLNGSPKGKNSVTVQTMNYIAKRFPQHSYQTLSVGLLIRRLEKNFQEAIDLLDWAELVVFSYPVYTFLAPSQLHRFIELMIDHGVTLEGKVATQISTSKHFYDTTAHQYIRENCLDLGAKYIRGLSSDMEDLLTDRGQQQADCYFEKLVFDIQHDIYETGEKTQPAHRDAVYQPCCDAVPKTGKKDVVVVTNVAEDDQQLQNMIADFTALCPHPVRLMNIRQFPFSGGCLGCFGCNTSERCIYPDRFDDYLRNEIQIADAIVYAFTIENHYTHSSMKCYDDRQFCNGHRSVTSGMPVGYIISGDYSKESNIQTLVEARSDVGEVYLSGVATDEGNIADALRQLTLSLDYALSHKMDRPKTFYGVGGAKIFRDLVYLMQGMMQADHKFYKKTGAYDFPQNQKMKILQMKLIGSAMANPKIMKKMGSKIGGYIVQPYEKLLDNTQPK